MKMQLTCAHCGEANEITITAQRGERKPPPVRARGADPLLPRMVRAWTRNLAHGDYTNAVLVEAYNAWARGAGAAPADAHALGRILAKQGHERWRTPTERGYTIYPPQLADLSTTCSTSAQTSRYDLPPGTKWQLEGGRWIVVPT